MAKSIEIILEKNEVSNHNFFTGMGIAYGLATFFGMYGAGFNINNAPHFSNYSNVAILCAGACYTLFRVGYDMKKYNRIKNPRLLKQFAFFR